MDDLPQAEQPLSREPELVVEQSSAGESLFDWGEAISEAPAEDVAEGVEKQPVEGTELLTRSEKDLMDEILSKALSETEERASRYEEHLEKIKAPTKDVKTLAERGGREKLKSYNQPDLVNKDTAKIEEMVKNRKEELRFAADRFAYLARGMETSLAEGDTETVVAVMRTELGGVDSVKDKVVEGVERLQKEKGTEAVVGLLPIYEQADLSGDKEMADKMVKVMEPAVGHEIWKNEVRKRGEPGGNLRRQGELRVGDMPDLLTGSGGLVRFKNLRGERMMKTRELFNEVEDKQMGLGEVMADTLTNEDVLDEVTRASVIGPTEGEREITNEEREKTTEILKLRLLGYMEAVLADGGKSLEMGTSRSLVKMMEAVAGWDKTAWQMINIDSSEVAEKMREMLNKIKTENLIMLGNLRGGLEASHNQKLTEISRQEDEARRIKEAEEAKRAEEVKIEAEKLAQEKLLADFLADIKDSNRVGGRIGFLKGIRFGAKVGVLKTSAEAAKNEEEENSRLAGEVMGMVASLIDSFDTNDLRAEKQGPFKTVRKPSKEVVDKNREDIKNIESDEDWKKDRSKVVDWTARMVFNRWLGEAKFDKNNRPITT